MDLRVWMKEATLLQVAQGIAQGQSVDALHPVFSLSGARFHHPWRLLALLTYSFGIGIFDVAEVAEAVRRVPGLRELCGNRAPTADALRRFRNRNREPLLRCVGELIRHACQHHQPREFMLHPALLLEILCEARLRVQASQRFDTGELVVAV